MSNWKRANQLITTLGVLFFWPVNGVAQSVALASNDRSSISVSSKSFTESYILGEIISQIAESVGEASKVERALGLGGTTIVFESLRNGEIDIYPDYTGTLTLSLLKKPELKTHEEIVAAMQAIGLHISRPLGFNNTYAIAIKKSRAQELGLKRIGDLRNYPDLKAGFSYEFLKRPDGYLGLKTTYNLDLQNIFGLRDGLSYDAIEAGEIDITDVNSTNAKVARFDLTILDDNKGFFPKYLSVMVVRKDFPQRFPKTWDALRRLENAIDSKTMTQVNSMVELDKNTYAHAASHFLNEKFGFAQRDRQSTAANIWRYTKEHCALVAISLFVAVLIGMLLGLLAQRLSWLGQGILITTSLVQTIPSLALLCFMVPLFGIGTLPALIALFIYSLLPIVRNTYIGLDVIDPRLKEAARSLGLSPWQQLLNIDIPLAMPMILGGIRTSAIINVGTATLASLIGAGGYGEPIVTGLALNNYGIIFQGALPAALLALVAYAGFELIEKLVVSPGLRSNNQTL